MSLSLSVFADSPSPVTYRTSDYALSAEAWAVRAADHGDIAVLRELAARREEARDVATAERLYRQAVDRGDTSVLGELARLRERAGDADGADRIRRFGLTGPGEIATALDFESPILGLSEPQRTSE